MKFLAFNLLLFFLMSFNIQAQEEKLILDFVSSCKTKKIKIAYIRDKYICETKNSKEKKASDKFIEDQISALRKELQVIDLSKLKIINAVDEPEIKKQFLNEDISKIFLLKDDTNVTMYFLIENNKIKSFSVMYKGDIKVFIILCS